MSAGANVSVSASASASAGVSVSASASAGANVSASASAGVRTSSADLLSVFMRFILIPPTHFVSTFYAMVLQIVSCCF